MKLTIQHVEVHASSLEKAREFYIEKLGLELIEEIPAINLIALKAGLVRISIFGGFSRNQFQSADMTGVHFVFQTDDIEKTHFELTAKGILFDGEIAEAPGFVRFLSTKDPDGNQIEFAQYLRDPLTKVSQ